MVAYTLRNICEKNYQFLSSIKKNTQKKIGYLFSASRCMPTPCFTAYFQDNLGKPVPEK